MCKPPAFQHAVVALSPRISQHRALFVSRAIVSCQLIFPVTTEHDIGTPPSHVGAMVTAPGRPAWAIIWASDSCCLAFRIFVINLGFLQQVRQALGRLDGRSAHQDGSTLGRNVFNFVDNGVEFFFFRQVHQIVVIGFA